MRKLQIYNALKEELVSEINATFSSLQKTTKQIGDIQTQICAMNEQESAVIAQANPEMVHYTRQMEQRAEDRLLIYQFYMAKAYEYRLLREYAPKKYGRARFEKWVDQSGKKLTDKNQVEIVLNSSAMIRPVFLYSPGEV